MNAAQLIPYVGMVAQALAPRNQDDAREGMADRFARSGSPAG